MEVNEIVRRKILVLLTVALMVALTIVMATSAFAQGTGDSKASRACKAPKLKGGQTPPQQPPFCKG
jgi:hypothetical protein